MARSAVERSCQFLLDPAGQQPESQASIQTALAGSDPEAKVLAMKQAILLLLSGEQLPQLFITIVRYVLPSEDHTVQKLLLLYLVGCWAGGCAAALSCRLARPGRQAGTRVVVMMGG